MSDNELDASEAKLKAAEGERDEVHAKLARAVVAAETAIGQRDALRAQLTAAEATSVRLRAAYKAARLELMHGGFVGLVDQLDAALAGTEGETIP